MEFLSQKYFSQRRADLLAQLPTGSAVVLFAPSEIVRNNDVHYLFRQDSYFWYFTGFPEPDAVAVLLKTASGTDYLLFNAPRDPLKEIWEGKIIGQDGAKQNFAVDESFPLTELSKLPELLKESSHIYTILGVKERDDQRIASILREIHSKFGRGGAVIDGIFDLRRVADEMRMIKRPEELDCLREAGKITVEGHLAAMRTCQPGLNEWHIHAAVEGEYRRYGCDWSFPTIAAAGANACCLHYRDNNASLKDGELLMVDSGAEYQFYAGDVSRTMPINGKFNKEQQALYEIVLASQKTGIDAARPGIRHLELHHKVCEVITQGLIDLGLLKGELNELIENGAFRKYYMHGTGHWLGIDVHDVGVYMVDGKSREYQPNMVVTVEPGIYVPADDPEVDEKWRGIGIRIEDDVIITEGEAEVPTKRLPKEVDEVEAVMRGA